MFLSCGLQIDSMYVYPKKTQSVMSHLMQTAVYFVFNINSEFTYLEHSILFLHHFSGV